MRALGWKRIFLILYIWFYSGVSITFFLIFLNGKFSMEEEFKVPVVVDKLLVRESRKGKCVGMAD